MTPEFLARCRASVAFGGWRRPWLLWPETRQSDWRPGTTGGWAHRDALVPSLSCFQGQAIVGPGALVGACASVLDYATVAAGAQLLDYTVVDDWAIVADGATVRDSAQVSGSALVCNGAVVAEQARVSGTAELHGDVYLGGNCMLLAGVWHEAPPLVQVGPHTLSPTTPTEIGVRLAPLDLAIFRAGRSITRTWRMLDITRPDTVSTLPELFSPQDCAAAADAYGYLAAWLRRRYPVQSPAATAQAARRVQFATPD